MYGALLATLVDTLGAHQLGGFKVGVGFARRICRTCMATKESIKNQVHQNLDLKLHAWIHMIHNNHAVC